MSILRVVFLVSGGGGSLKFIHLAARQLGLPLEVVAVLADRDCGALHYADKAGLAHQQLAYSRKNPTALQQAIREANPHVVVTNIHKIIDPETLSIVPGGYVNLHYSLLPSFKGLIGMETVEQARQLNVTVIGATCHEVDEQVDNGNCIGQFAVGIDWKQDTPEQVYDLVFRGASLVLLQSLLQRVGKQREQRTATLSIRGKTLLFAPALTFNAAGLDDIFWQQVAGS